jgi:hypothetical protein
MKEEPPQEPDKVPRKYQKPLSLAPLTFSDAVQRIAKAKPLPRKRKKKKK